MENEAIYLEQTINAPIDRVWRAISEREELRHWFYDITRFWPELGCDFQFNYHKNGKKYVVLCRITEIVDKRKLGFDWQYEGMEGKSHVQFELIPADKDTIFKITHRGIKELEQNGKLFTKNKLEADWKNICESLKDYAEREIIHKSVTIQADPSIVWDILTGKDEMNNWANSFRKGYMIESNWREGSDVVWKDDSGKVIARGIVTVNNPEHYLKVFYPCYDETSCALNPGEDYQIYILTGFSENQTLLEVECKTYTDSTGSVSVFWENALKKIKKLSEKAAQEELIY